MTRLLQLYQYAENEGIDVDLVPMRRATSLSVPLPNGQCAIALDPWMMETVAEEVERLAHELGHCKTGAFYNRHASRDVRQKHENRADKWAIKKLVPKNEFDKAISDGCTEIYELAERFNLPIPLAKKVACWYIHGNLNVEVHFPG